MNEKIAQNLKQKMNEEEDINSWETVNNNITNSIIKQTPDFMEKGFNLTLIPLCAFGLNIFFNEFNSFEYLTSLCLLTDWIGYISSGYVKFFF